MALVPVKFGIGFLFVRIGLQFYNELISSQYGFLTMQAEALVHVYMDGSVLLTHDATEMGQGLHTRMVQVASIALGVHIERVNTTETSTATVPNLSVTAASASSYLNEMAILRACATIMERLKLLQMRNYDGVWEDWISAGYKPYFLYSYLSSGISLSPKGFSTTSNTGFDSGKVVGNLYNYFTRGAACFEVEIDCLTRDHNVPRNDVIFQIRRTDIAMAVGNSLNPEQRYSPDGFLLTRGPGAYRIPAFTDIPLEFNVSLLRGASNPKAVHSSKAIGEPPLFLSASVFYAIKEAVKAARSESGLTGSFRFDSPATAMKIRMGCVDQFTEQVHDPNATRVKCASSLNCTSQL
ncbi:hypothetical protein CAPTEDRAFT_210476 [Capitella teleta]|uniref:Aldehyde oxidase/xanthine dehydrogenase second molybdopterin binding domain-containing protein n=1 Tax=Capitella teleta TaxID=283909 RepID=R7VL06_CAPTE|nr:hypothetical protein CAPTEDRAFT_210476 [Capitella teleta]|eukprot:ELU17190.1 hypothetical protein CAPTEDRAFT_210476 [Capitella teleta]